MNFVSKLLCTATVLLFVNTSVMADADADIKKAHAAVQKMIPTVPIEAIQPSPLPGVYQVMIPPQMFYISADGRYAIDGDLIDLQSGENVTNAVRDQMRLAAVNAQSEASMIVYGPKNPTHTITVFTDIDCGYCRKLHKEIDQYTNAGIKVRYMAYPRAGLNSGSYQKAVAVWCSKDRNDALTRAKLGEEIKAKDCDNPVAQQYELAQKLGLRGTPAIITEQGQVLPGYVPAAQLKLMLDAHVAKK